MFIIRITDRAPQPTMPATYYYAAFGYVVVRAAAAQYRRRLAAEAVAAAINANTIHNPDGRFIAETVPVRQLALAYESLD